MKILKIKALNINSLKGETEIDFCTFLNGNALFAITGPTGSGKSSILDIITCALYGRTSRLKSPNELMAKHTGECFCEVEFEIKGTVYRSSWSQKRARKKADARFQSAKMELCDVATSKVLKATLRDVPKEIEKLSGLDFDKFSQSMMLAQGSFDAFLKAKESDRSSLLEKITGTQIYAKISKEIYDTYALLKSDIDTDRKLLDATELLEAKELGEKREALKTKKQEKLDLDKKVKKVTTIKTWVETLSKLEEDDEKYTALFSSIFKEREKKEEEFKKLALATQALNVQTLYDRQIHLLKNIEDDDKTHRQLVSDLDGLKESLIEIQVKYRLSQEEMPKAKEIFDSEIQKIKEVKTLEIQIIEKQKTLNALKIKISTKTEAQSKLQKEDIEKLKLEYQSNIDIFRREIEGLNTTFERYNNEYKSHDRNKLSNEKYLIDSVKEHIETLYKQKESELLIQKYEEDRKLLKRGDNCFLCGSKEHRYIDENIHINTTQTVQLLSIKKEELKQLENELTKKYKEKEELLQKKETINKQIHLKQNHILKSTEQLTHIHLKQKEMETRLISLKNELEVDIKTKNDYHASLIEINAQIIQVLNVSDINFYEKEINDNFKQIQDEEHRLNKELVAIKTKYEALLKQEIDLKEKLFSSKQKLETLKKDVKDALKDNDFETIESFEKAMLSKEEREILLDICHKIEDKYKEYQTLNISCSKALAEHKKQDIEIKPLDALHTELQTLQSTIDTLQESIGALVEVLKRDNEDREKNKVKILELEKKKDGFKVWVKLNEMIGSADGNKFAKFAQGITLDQLINLANNHLTVISSRYELQRSSEQKHLLELEIIDSFQGNAVRPIGTLSGGESFIVSLSLALGLSELASQKIAIDSLFLDEGFGSLDEDSLETALNALSLLQSSGKMIGVISHVEALKEQIPLQIKVIPKGDGTSFVEVGQ